MTDAVGSSFGSSLAFGIAATGYQVSWVQVRFPHESGYQVSWVQIRLPYLTGNAAYAAGTSTVDAIGAAVSSAAWEGIGTATVVGVGSAEYGITTADALGTSDVQGIGASLADAIGNASGIGQAYAVNPILFLVAVGSGDGAKAKRRVVNDELDLYDLAEIWSLLRKAA